MKGARIGVPSDPADPLNDCYYGKLPPTWAKVVADAIKVLEDLGAVIVGASMPTAGWIGGPGTTMAVLNRLRSLAPIWPHGLNLGEFA